MLEDNSYFVSGQCDEDKVYIQKKMGFTESEFEEILNSPPKSHFDYPSFLHLTRALSNIKKIILSIK